MNQRRSLDVATVLVVGLMAVAVERGCSDAPFAGDSIQGTTTASPGVVPW